MANNPFTGAGYLIQGFQLITRPKLRRFVIIPLLVNIVLFAGFVYSMFLGTGWLDEQLQARLPDWLDWLSFLLWPVFFLCSLLIMLFGFTIVGNLISAPFNGLLAEAVEHHLTDQPLRTESGWSAIGGELIRTIRSELRKLMYIVMWAIPCLILLLIPLVNTVGSLLWLAFGAWMMAIQFADYPMGNHGLTFPDQRKLLAKRRLTSLGFGAAVMMCMVVPVVNFVVMPASVAGATVMWVEGFSKLSSQAALIEAGS